MYIWSKNKYYFKNALSKKSVRTSIGLIVEITSLSILTPLKFLPEPSSIKNKEAHFTSGIRASSFIKCVAFWSLQGIWIYIGLKQHRWDVAGRILIYTVCPRSLEPFYIVPYYKNWDIDKTSLTYYSINSLFFSINKSIYSLFFTHFGLVQKSIQV